MVPPIIYPRHTACGEPPFSQGAIPMSISMSNFATATEKSISPQGAASAVAQAREAVGYTIDHLAVTTGLTVDELTAIERGEEIDASRLQRIAAALGLPATTFLVA